MLQSIDCAIPRVPQFQPVLPRVSQRQGHLLLVPEWRGVVQRCQSAFNVVKPRLSLQFLGGHSAGG